jgi:hypothetical protein
MAGWSGVLIGAIALAALEVAVSSQQATAGFGTLVQLPGQWALNWMDPTKPLLPNWAKAPCAEGGDVSVFSLMSYSPGTSSAATVPAAATQTTPYQVPTGPAVPTPAPTPQITYT